MKTKIKILILVLFLALLSSLNYKQYKETHTPIVYKIGSRIIVSKEFMELSPEKRTNIILSLDD